MEGTQSLKPKTPQNLKKNAVIFDLQPPKLPAQNLPLADINKPKTQQRPKKASAWGKYNSSVKQETVSKNFSKTNQPKGPGSSQPTQNQPTKNLSLKEQLKLLQQKSEQKEKQKFAALDTNREFKTGIGVPTGGNTDDYLPNFKIGNKTYLNTLANPNIAYYVELKRKFRMTFAPKRALQGHWNEVSRGQLACIWGVSVDSNGNLSGLKLIRSSGLSSYDYEAQRTIRASAPFSRPPSNMLVNGNLDMAWTFVVYL